MSGKKLPAARLSILVNSFFVILKVAVGLLSGSIAILAEAIHSLLDLLASILAYLGIMKGDEQFDETHPYGHEKFENLSAILQVILIAATSIIIIYEAMGKFANPGVDFEEYGIALMAFTTVVSYRLSKYLHAIGIEEHSHALEADAYHFTTDVWASLAVMAGLALSMLGFPQADPLAAIFVALMMLRLAFETGTRMLDILLEHSADRKEIAEIERIIRADRNVVHYHKLRARYIGARIWVDVHIHLRDMELRKAHAIAHSLKERIMEAMPKVKEVNIHVEPH